MPLLSTKLEAAFTSTEEKIALYEWVHDQDMGSDRGWSAYAGSVPVLNFKVGDLDPALCSLKVYDCTPDGWASYQAELDMWNTRYPDGPPALEL